MKLPYHRYSDHVQPDPMHTITDVCQNILDWLCENKDFKKLLDAEQELQIKKPKLCNDAVTPLTCEEKIMENQRCNGLVFPLDCSGFKGDVFSKPKVVLKKTHGWTEVI